MLLPNFPAPLRAMCQSLILGGLSSGVAAQTWFELPCASGPWSAHCAAYDHVRSRLVLLSGDRTYECDGTNWVDRLPRTRPPARGNSAMAFDPIHGRVVMFGGQASGFGNVLADTWTWDGVDWRPETQSGPAPRFGHAMVFDAARGKVVLFGGRWINYPTDTWEWDGSSWQLIPTATAPQGREAAGMAFDPQRNRTVLFGGTHYTGTFYQTLGDTWEYVGGNWQQVASSGPPAHFDVALGYSAADGGVMLLSNGSATPASWRWNGAWSLLTVTGP